MSPHLRIKLLLRVLAGLILLGGMVPLGLGIWTYHICRTFLETAQKAEGTVIQVIERRHPGGESAYSPRVRFVDGSGIEHEVTSGGTSYPSRYGVGESVPILYDPDQPTEFHIDSWFDLWFAPALCAGMFGMAVLFAAFVAFPGPLIIQGMFSGVKGTGGQPGGRPRAGLASVPPVIASQRGERLEDNPGMRMLLPLGRSGYAIAAGYLGLLSVLLVPAPVALVFGILGIRDVRRSRTTIQRKYGMGRAICGVVMGGIFSIVLAAMGVSLLLE